MSNDRRNSPLEIDKIIHEPARLQIMTQLYVVEEADFIFLMRKTGLTWGNLSSHMSKLEDAEYIEVRKEFLDKKPHTILKLTEKGRESFNRYRKAIDRVFKDLPD
ncbi:MAG: winged helix-turn-helix domain-containing protein [Candidatus Thorarchaeota archaeon]